MVCWWVHCGWPGFQVEDDPKNVQKRRKMSGKFAVSLTPEINLCALKEPNKCHGLPALPTKVDYIRTSVNPVHNAHVCYFNNVWLMFLVF
jgi:hypothetical protein